MIKFTRTAIGAALLAVAGIASAATTVATVDANNDSFGATSGLDTGVFLTTNEAFTVTVPTTEIWTNGVGVAAYDTNANGNSNMVYTITSPVNGVPYTDLIGSLVGQVGNGAFFHVGANYSNVAQSTGDLKLFFFDTDIGNNGGEVHATITAVPEPTNVALLGLALGAFALTRRRKQA